LIHRRAAAGTGGRAFIGGGVNEAFILALGADEFHIPALTILTTVAGHYLRDNSAQKSYRGERVYEKEVARVLDS
jgi:hypothetical protein